MATINYKFADGHFEEIEVSEEFKREYEFLLVQENAQYWKIKKQKQRAGLEVKYDLSLDRLSEDGYEPSSFAVDPLEQLIEEEEKQEYYKGTRITRRLIIYLFTLCVATDCDHFVDLNKMVVNVLLTYFARDMSGFNYLIKFSRLAYCKSSCSSRAFQSFY